MPPTSKSETDQTVEDKITHSGGESGETVELYDDGDELVTRAEFEQLCETVEKLITDLAPVIAYYKNR